MKRSHHNDRADDVASRRPYRPRHSPESTEQPSKVPKLDAVKVARSDQGPSEGLAPSVAAHYNSIEEKGLGERLKSPIVHLRNFNNWVKSMLIKEFVDRLAAEHVDGFRPVVLDLGCGKGGDLLKWKKAEIKHLMCVDIAATSVDQCRTRYQESRRREQSARHPQPLFSAEFLVADFTRVRVCPQLGPAAGGVGGAGAAAAGAAGRQADLVSVQFALHYGFESLPQAERMLSNIAECLKPGGYFIATLPDAGVLMRRLRRQSSDGRRFGNTLYQVCFNDGDDDSSAAAVAAPPPLFGARYDFFLEGVVDCPEFLVYWPLLVHMCAARGLKPVFRKSFADMFHVYGREGADGHFLLSRMQALETYPAQDDTPLIAAEDQYEHAARAMHQMPQQRCVGTMSRCEWQASTLYMAVAFRKDKAAK